MIKNTILMTALITAAGLAACAEPPTIAEQPKSNVFQERWQTGINKNEAEIQVQFIDKNTVALRQSITTSYEAPFMYLLFGGDRTLLIDTGAEGIDIRGAVDKLVTEWLKKNGQSSTTLTVMHTHGHGDHVAGDASFADRPNTEIVGHSAKEVAAYFAIENWPTEQASFDLGNRTVDILPTPGHHPSHVMVYDRSSKILFSGDALYPGRLYFQCGKLDEYGASVKRLTAFAETHEITTVLGAHIELALDPGKQFTGQEKARYDERLLELPAAVIGELSNGLDAAREKLVITPYSNFILFPHPANPRGKTPPNWCLSE